MPKISQVDNQGVFTGKSRVISEFDGVPEGWVALAPPSPKPPKDKVAVFNVESWLIQDPPAKPPRDEAREAKAELEATDVKMPRVLEDILDALEEAAPEVFAKVAQQTRDLRDRRKAAREKLPL